MCLTKQIGHELTPVITDDTNEMNNDDKCLCLTHGCSMPSSVLSSSQVNSFDGDQLSGPREIIRKHLGPAVSTIWAQVFHPQKARGADLCIGVHPRVAQRTNRTPSPTHSSIQETLLCIQFNRNFKKKQGKELTSHFKKILPNTPRRMRSGPGQSETLGRPLDQGSLYLGSQTYIWGAPRKGHI